MNKNAFVETAIAAARAAEEIIRYYYQRPLDVEFKSDDTPVTVADREAERLIKEGLSAVFPEHGFWGEETGPERLEQEYLWLIDPIDGTKSFVREYPFFSTQIALMQQGKLIVGVSNAPIFAELAWASQGQGAYLNDEPLRVSQVHHLEDAILSFGNIKSFIRSHNSAFTQLVERCNRIRGYGDFYHSHLLAAGKIDLVVESDLGILDIAALSLIVQEAGGEVSDLSGAPIGLNSTSYIASNSLLHHQLFELL